MPVSAMRPTPLMLPVPVGHCCTSLADAVFDLNSGENGESLPVAIDPSHYAALHCCSLVPVAHKINLVYGVIEMYPLYVQSLIVRPTIAPTPVPRFSLVESLTIQSLQTQISGDAAITAPLLSLLARMPRLRKLCVYGLYWPSPTSNTATHDLQYPDLPCNLEEIFLFGALPIASCAHIISHSRDSLRELRVNTMDPSEPDGVDEALLIFAIAQAAPRLRILDLRLGSDDRPLSRYTPVFAALDRIETMDLEIPQNTTPQEALDLLCHAPIRALTLRSLHLRSFPHAPAHINVSRLQPMRCLRSITLLNFALDGESRRALSAHCRARRIRCQAPTM